MSLASGIDEIFKTFESFTKSGDVRYSTDLETVDDDETFVLNDGSLMTLVRVMGCMTLVGQEEYESINEGVHAVTKNSLSAIGHSVIVYFHRDPNDLSEVNQCFDGMRGSIKTFGMDGALDVIEDWESAISNYVSKEGIYMSLVTRTNKLPPETRRTQKSELVKQGRDAIEAFKQDGQRINRIATKIRDSHKAFVNNIISELKSPNVKVIAEKVDVRDGIRLMRKAISPTGKTYKPILPGDKIPLRVKDDINNRYGIPDIAEFYYPNLARQIFKDDAVFLDNTIVKWGDKYWRGFVMDIPPEEPSNFNVIFGKISVNTEWRMAFHLEADGMGPLWWKSALTGFFKKTSSINERFERAKAQLKEEILNGEAVVRFRCSASVCVDFGKYGHDSQRVLVEQSSDLVESINAWGHATTVAPMGMGQILSITSTIPGLRSWNPAPAAAAPLMDVVGMLPFLRPASIWEMGTPYRTMDGRFLPFLEGSSKQASFIEVGSGGLGSGKSVNANVANFTFFVSPGQPRMPFLSIVDIGPSSSGVISLIRESLPEDQRYLAIYVRMRNTVDKCVNPQDTSLGLDRPLPLHKEFLINFWTLIGTPYADNSPPDEVPGMASMILDKAYNSLSRHKSPHIYRSNYAPDNPDCNRLDRIIQEDVNNYLLEIDAKTSWWDIVDYFFKKGDIGNASIAQRFAVPTFAEVMSYLKDEQVVRQYGEEATHKFYTKCSEALQRYAIFSGPTRFTIGDARAVALDLDEVATKGSSLADRQTAVMYMLARHLTLSRFFIQEDDAKLIHDHGDAIGPLMYRAYYEHYIAGLKQDHKRIFFDEFHRVSKSSSVAAQIVSDLQTVTRETRKWNIHIAIYSQEPDDIPETIASLSTTAFVFGVNGKRGIAEKAAQNFGMDASAIDAMVNGLKKPDRKGSTLIARYVTSEGTIIQQLRNTVGPVALWAFSSTREDTILRDRLYSEFGPKEARRVLAKMFPGGSIKEDLFEPIKDILSMPEPLDGFKAKNLGKIVPYYQEALKEKSAGDLTQEGIDPGRIIYFYIRDRLMKE